MSAEWNPYSLPRLRKEFLDKLDVQPFESWSPALLNALIGVLDLYDDVWAGSPAPEPQPSPEPYQGIHLVKRG